MKREWRHVFQLRQGSSYPYSNFQIMLFLFIGGGGVVFLELRQRVTLNCRGLFPDRFSEIIMPMKHSIMMPRAHDEIIRSNDAIMEHCSDPRFRPPPLSRISVSRCLFRHSLTPWQAEVHSQATAGLAPRHKGTHIGLVTGWWLAPSGVNDAVADQPVLA